MAKTKKQTRRTPHKAQQSVEATPIAADSASLRQIANTLGFLVVNSSDFKDKTDTGRILFLSNLGFDRNSVAAIVGTTPQTVSTRLSEAKAQQAKKPA